MGTSIRAQQCQKTGLLRCTVRARPYPPLLSLFASVLILPLERSLHPLRTFRQLCGRLSRLSLPLLTPPHLPSLCPQPCPRPPSPGLLAGYGSEAQLPHGLCSLVQLWRARDSMVGDYCGRRARRCQRAKCRTTPSNSRDRSYRRFPTFMGAIPDRFRSALYPD